MKLQNLIPRKLQMTAARRTPQPAEEFEEPNVKLTSAFAVVLILHVVAVGGIYAFNSLKTHKIGGPEKVAVSPPKIVLPVAPNESKSWVGNIHQVKSGETVAKVAAQHGVNSADLEAMNGLSPAAGLHVGQELKIPTKAPAKTMELASIKSPDKSNRSTATAAPLKDSGQIHTVGKGETPVTIARKLNVSYDDLLKLNKIEDPKKLQIGQKLKVPAKAKS